MQLQMKIGVYPARLQASPAQPQMRFKVYPARLQASLVQLPMRYRVYLPLCRPHLRSSKRDVEGVPPLLEGQDTILGACRSIC